MNVPKNLFRSGGDALTRLMARERSIGAVELAMRPAWLATEGVAAAAARGLAGELAAESGLVGLIRRQQQLVELATLPRLALCNIAKVGQEDPEQDASPSPSVSRRPVLCHRCHAMIARPSRRRPRSRRSWLDRN